MHQSNKSQPIRTCSCASCRNGRSGGRSGGSFVLALANRRIRRAGKPHSLAHVNDYDGMTTPMTGAGYTD